MKLFKASTFIFFLCINFSFGQNVLISSIDNSVPKVNDQKLMDMLVSATEYHGITPIELRIILSEGESEKIRGIENRYVTIADLNLQAFDLLSGEHLGSKDIRLTGTGNSESASCRELIKSIRRKKQKLTTWMTGMDQGAIDCNQLRQKAESLLRTNDFEGAFILANNQNCQEGAFELKEKIILAYQGQTCDNALQKAEALVAIKNYEKAVYHILRIDPDSNCGEKVNALIDQIGDNYQADTDQAYDFYLKYLANEENTRKERAMLFEIILLNKLLDE